MTTPTESIRNAIVAELARQVEHGGRKSGMTITYDLCGPDRHTIHIDGYIDLDALAAAIAEHVA